MLLWTLPAAAVVRRGERYIGIDPFRPNPERLFRQAYGTKVSVTPGTAGITAGATAVSDLCAEQTGTSNFNSAASDPRRHPPV